MVIWEHQSAFREHSNCTRNAFVSELDWQANAFKWSFGAPKCISRAFKLYPKCICFSVGLASKCIQMVISSTKVHFVSIQTVPEMHLFLSRTGKQMHSNGHLEHQCAFREHSNCTRNAFVSESGWQANAFKWSFGSTKVHLVSIQTVPEMQMHISAHCHRNVPVQYQNRQANAFQQAIVRRRNTCRNGSIIWEVRLCHARYSLH